MNLVAGAVGSIITKLGELLHGEYKLQKGLQGQIEYLKNELESAHTALCKVGEMPPEHLDPQVRLWAGDVREASYDMEDILDTFLINVMDGAAPAENKSKKGLLKRLKKMGKLLKKSKARHDIAGAIEDMKKRLQEVWDRRDRYSIPVAVPAPATKLDPRLLDMHKEASQIIGIERTRAELIAMLKPSTHGHGDASASSSSNPSKIVSVVGAGGLGKTTLVKAVYDQLSTGYDCRAFVSVGRNPDLVQVFTNIFYQVDKEEYKAICDTKDSQLLIGELRKSLGNKRYFIVIDDVWDINSWQALGSVLHQNNNGSRVVKTTRNLEVACGDEVYTLGSLSHDNSKKLFYTRLYGGEGKCPAHHPGEASQKILDKCGGVPLAIITMASLLVGKSREDWFRVCSSPGFYHDRENKQVDDTMWILSLSYYDLPSHLKTCLLYLSVYPEDYFIHKDSLIWRWVAEGFIQEKRGASLFQRGEEYFHQLINRSMIQGVESKNDGVINRCRVHDMVLDLICGLADEENFVTISKENGGTSSLHKVRRLAYQNMILMDQPHPDSHRDMAQLRTLVAIQCDLSDWVLSPSFKLLRVLSLDNCIPSDNSECGRNWLEHLGKLVHLRYLMISSPNVKGLPEAIGDLKLLQILILFPYDVGAPIQLPLSVSLLTRLVCLEFNVNIIMPDGFFQKVTSLEQLHITFGTMSFESNRQYLKQLGNLSLLRKLVVVGMPRLDESMQADLLKSLGNLQELQYLEFNGFQTNDTTLEWEKAMLSEHVSDLDLKIFSFPCVPSFINPTLLPNLLNLVLCVDQLDETAMRALGGMPYLLHLYIKTELPDRMFFHEQSMVINIAASDVFFPKLRSLNLHGWMVQLGTNDDSAIASLSIWAGGHDAKLFRSKAEDQGRSRVPPAAVVMPNLRELKFTVYVRAFYMYGQSICDNLGLDLKCLPSLQSVKAYINRAGALRHHVNKVIAELRRLAQLHPNSSLTLEIREVQVEVRTAQLHPNSSITSEIREVHVEDEDVSELESLGSFWYDTEDEEDMTLENVLAANSQSGREEENEEEDEFELTDEDVSKPESALYDTEQVDDMTPDDVSAANSQYGREEENEARRLKKRIGRHLYLYEFMKYEEAKMSKLVTKLNLNDDTKNKVQQFHEQFNTMFDRMEHQLLPVQDLTRRLEHALDILNLEYPLLATLLDELRYAFSLQGAMPMPQVLNLNICVCDIKDNKLGLDIGLLGKISSLRVIKAHIFCHFCFPTEVEEVEAELRQMVDIHHPNNAPMLEIIRYAEDRMVNSDSDSQMLVERQKRMARRLQGTINQKKRLHNSMKREADEMGVLLANFNVTDDTKNKVQEFCQKFTATVQRVQHKLHPVENGTPIHDRDLTRLLEDIKAMEQALEIFTVEYPRFAAMLDELRYALSLQEAMPLPHLLILNIRVFDIMVNKVGLKFGLLGKVSSLQVIKAHLFCHYCFPTEVKELEAELKQAVDMHHPNNPPMLEIIRFAEDRMVKSDSDSEMFERQKWRGRILSGRIEHQKELHNILRTKVVKMVGQKTRMNLSDDVKHKERRFHKHFQDNVVRVQQELLRVYENIPNRDLKRMTEEITDMERALHILTVEYPRMVAMHEELKTALSIEVEDEDEITQEVEVSEVTLYDTEEEDEVPAALLSDIEHEDDVSVEEEVSAASVSERKEEYKVTVEVVSAASLSKPQGEEPIHL